MPPRDIVTVSINAARKMGDQNSLYAMINEIEHQIDVWDIVFICEYDGVTSERDISWVEDHYMYRHWPGPGSFSMAFIVHKRLRYALKSIVPHGRALQAYFKDDMALDLVVIGVHGGHEDSLQSSFADVSYLLRSSKRLSSKVVIGDHNIDLLPALANDPWASRTHRQQHHEQQRDYLHAFCDRSGLCINIPDQTGDPLTGPWASHNLECVFSRIPIGDQTGLPSLLDYALSSASTVSSSSLVWNSFSDHAFLISRLHARSRKNIPRPKRSWDYKDWEQSVDYFSAVAPDEFDSWERFHDCILDMQQTTGVSIPCKQKSRQRELTFIKDIRKAIRGNADCNVDRILKKNLWEARKSWLQSLRDCRDAQTLTAGKPLSRRKKLKAITSMRHNNETTIDLSVAATWVKREFEAKWKSHDLHRRSVINDELAKLSVNTYEYCNASLTEAAETPSKQRRTDHYGIPLVSIRIALRGAPVATTNLLNKLFKDDKFFKSIKVSGSAFAKKEGTIYPRQVRAITPLPSILILFDCLIDRALRKSIQAFACTVGSGYMETAIAGRQILDATFSLSQHVEKTLDMQGQGCIAAADILAYFDHLDPLRICRWLLRQGFPPSLAGGLLRLHCLPAVELRVGDVAVTVSSRTTGFFTGTRAAGSASRIPLLDAAHERLRVWNQLSSEYNGVNFSLTSFVDNVYATGRNVSDAVAILKDLEQHLSNKWRLSFGADSKEILPTAGCQTDALDALSMSEWPVKRTMKCLGHFLTSNGSIEEDFLHAKTCMWSCFWANFRPGLKRAPRHAKINFLERCVRPIASFKWSRWPFQPTYAKKLDQIQTHMLSLLFPCAPLMHEGTDDYFRRRSLNTGRLATSAGRWSASWAVSVQRWHDHVMRAHDETNWCHYVYNFHGQSWLDLQRRMQSKAGETNRTCTRSAHGKVTRRWFEGHAFARTVASAT